MTKQSIPQRMHEQMHQLPGVPEHGESEDLNRRGGLLNRPLQNRPLQNRGAGISQHHGRPKVLVGWQNAIGRVFSRWEK